MALINQGGKLLLRDGKLGTGQGCCCGGGGACDCALGMAGRTIIGTVNVTIGNPMSELDCQASSASASGQLTAGPLATSLGAVVAACLVLPLEDHPVFGEINARAFVAMYCSYFGNGEYSSAVFFNTAWTSTARAYCNGPGGSCYLGGFSYTGFGPTEEEYAIHGSAAGEGGTCYPLSGGSTMTSYDEQATVSWFLSVT